MEISTVIPTCNRKKNLLNLLQCLDRSVLISKEIIITDSGEDHLSENEMLFFNNLNIQYILTEKSVCIQRNIGIRLATAEWIFICDDDIEPPEDYLLRLANHIHVHPEAGAVSGLIMQQEAEEWVSNYPVHSNSLLLWKYIFGLGIWGPLLNKSQFFMIKKINQHYLKKANHISKAGWPVLTNFDGDYFVTPVYGLGASLIKKEWLLISPFDETLDRHGIGDNYAVAVQFPAPVHVVNNAFAYHHQEQANRLKNQLIYYRRALALDYFRQTIPALKQVRKMWLLWSLKGNFFYFIFTRRYYMIKPSLKSIFKIAFGKNPYVQARLQKQKIIEPTL